MYEVDPVSQPEDPSLVWMASPWVVQHPNIASEAGLYVIWDRVLGLRYYIYGGQFWKWPCTASRYMKGGWLRFPRGEQLRCDQLYPLTNEMTSIDRDTDGR